MLDNDFDLHRLLKGYKYNSVFEGKTSKTSLMSDKQWIDLLVKLFKDGLKHISDYFDHLSKQKDVEINNLNIKIEDLYVITVIILD